MGSVQIQLFGAFRKFGNGVSLDLPLAAPCTVSVLKELLAAHLDSDLLNESAFGSADEIFRDDAVISPGRTIALLPPVCGG